MPTETKGHGEHAEKEIHRELRLVTPYRDGPDVREVQDSINAELEGFKLRGRCEKDGEAGPETFRLGGKTLYAVGADQEDVDDARDHDRLSKHHQLIIRQPEQRGKVMDDRSKNRVAELRKRQDSHEGGAKKAVAWFMNQVGQHEEGSSNWGVPVQDWIKYTGYGSPVPWCGCVVCYASVHEGGADIPNRIRLGYHLNIVSDARNHSNGLVAVSLSNGKKGDLVAFDFAHIAMLREDYDGSGYIRTVEGNTSASSGGSQNNGGEVAAKTRSIGDVLVIARPAY